MSALRALFIREMLVAGRVGGSAMGIAFLLALATLVPFGVGPDLALLARIGPAILWVGALLSVLIGLDRLFAADLEDGSLDLLRLGPHPLELVVLVKSAVHWITTCLPLALAAPALGFLYGLGARGLAGLGLSLLVGTPALTLIGAVGAAATVGLRRGGLLLPLLVMPLSVPVLIFGAAAAEAASDGRSFATPLALLGSVSLAALAMTPFAAAAALRASGE